MDLLLVELMVVVAAIAAILHPWQCHEVFKMPQTI